MRSRVALCLYVALLAVPGRAMTPSSPPPGDSKEAVAQRAGRGFSVMAKRDGVLLFATYPDKSCTIEVKGRYGGMAEQGDHPIVAIDGELLEFNVLPLGSFLSEAAMKEAARWSPVKVLAAHIMWDAGYAEKMYQEAKMLEGDLRVTLGDHTTPAGLYYATWEFGVPGTPPAPSADSGAGEHAKVSHRLFAETLLGTRVVQLGTTVTRPAELEARRRYLARALESIEVIDGPLDVERLQRDFQR